MSKDLISPLQKSHNLVAARRQSLIERFTAQVAFARELASLEGENANGWDTLITKAEDVVLKRLPEDSYEALESAVRVAEEKMAPIAAVAKTHTIYCVGHGHIDMNWMWSWPETVAATNDTFLTVLKLMDEFPAFRYSQSQVSVYEIVHRHNPELFQRIVEKVKEGRWEVLASHWVEGDKNIASGESLTRHLLYTRLWMKEHMGLEAEDVAVDWSPDTFGHAWSIPTIDAQGGVRRYYLCRGGDQENPPVFWWEGPDGARILVNKEIRWYNSTIEPSSAHALLEFRRETGLRDWMQVYGVGDHGGGPTRRDIKRAIDMNAWPVYPNLRFATTQEYFAILEKHGEQFPVIKRELNFEFSGCYTSQSAIKRANRFGENAAASTEVAAVRAMLATGQAYPAASLRESWTDVLFSHFHDILPGSCVPDTRFYCLGTFQKVMAATGMIKTNSLRAVANAIDTTLGASNESDAIPAAFESIAMGGGAGLGSALGGVSLAGHAGAGPRPIVVFNPSAWPRQEVVRTTIWDAHSSTDTRPIDQVPFIVRSAGGKSVPAQMVGSGDYWGHRFVELAFPVTVGAWGHATYVIEEGRSEDSTPGVTVNVDAEGRDRVSQPSGSFTLENSHMTVAFNRATGGIISLVDKKTGRDMASPAAPMGVLEYAVERPQGGSAWILASHKEDYRPLTVEWFGAGEPGGWSTPASRRGPHTAQASAKMRVNDSEFTVHYRLKADEPGLEIAIEGRWLERGGPEIGTPRLAIRFPVNIESASLREEIPFGTIVRDVAPGRETPALRWVDVFEKTTGSGVAVLNDSKYSHALDGSTLRVTLIRSTYNPDPLPEIGDHSIRFCVIPHDRAVDNSDLIRLGASFNHPLDVVSTDVHGGHIAPESGDAISVQPQNVLVTQAKGAESGDGVILRLQETSGQDTEAEIALNPESWGRVTRAASVDLLERPLSSGAELKDGKIVVMVPAFSIASIKISRG